MNKIFITKRIVRTIARIQIILLHTTILFSATRLLKISIIYISTITIIKTHLAQKTAQKKI